MSIHRLFFFTLCIISAALDCHTSAAAVQELVRGFQASPDSQSPSPFQPVLTDSTGNFSLGFLRVKGPQFDIAVVHLPSLEPLWTPNISFPRRRRRRRRHESASVVFDGSLVISNHDSGVLWSTETKGDRLLLLGDSNLRIVKGRSVLWESFSFPGDTLVQNQNFTANMSVVSSNGLYSMRLGDEFIALYARPSKEMYWRHGALQARATVVPGKGPIYARVNTEGFLGMYQTEEAPIDVEAFDNFQRTSGEFLRLRLEQDGNIKAYCWYDSQWVQVYVGIKGVCQLPNPCGQYGICSVDGSCSCMDKSIGEYGRCSAVENGDLCSRHGGREEFRVLKEVGVELPFKEMMEFETMGSVGECEGACEKNCSCWGAVYNNGSGACYLVWYPIQTVLKVGDDGKMGYFKIRMAGKRTGMGVGVLVGFLVFFAAAGLLFLSYTACQKRKAGGGRKKNGAALEEESWPGPYKTLDAPSTAVSVVQLSGGRG